MTSAMKSFTIITPFLRVRGHPSLNYLRTSSYFWSLEDRVCAFIAVPILPMVVPTTVHTGTLDAAVAARVEICDHSQSFKRVVVQAVQADPTELFVLESVAFNDRVRPAPVAHCAHKVWHLYHLLSTGEGAPLPRLMALLGLEDVARECHVA